MFYIIQENLFREEHYDNLIETLQKFKFDYEIVKFEQFEDHRVIRFNTDRKDVFCFGAVKMTHIANQYGWVPGSMMNENHDYEVYSKGFGLENMLNGDAKVINLKDPVPLDNYLFFARPCRDTKLFSGQVFTQESWKEMVEPLKTNEKVLVAPIKETQQEVRCWVIDGKVVTASRYKLGRRVSYQNYDDESFFTDFAQKMVDKYQIAKAFVLDVCLSNDELKIVEANCINCAGFYHANMHKLIEAIEYSF